MQIRGHTPGIRVSEIGFPVKVCKLLVGLEIDHTEVWSAGLQSVGEHAAVADGGVGLEAQQRGPRAVLELGVELGRAHPRRGRARGRETRSRPRRSSPRETGSGCRPGCRARAGSHRRCRDRRAAARAVSWTSPAAATAGGSGRRSRAGRRRPPTPPRAPAAAASRIRSSRWCSRRRRLACRLLLPGG